MKHIKILVTITFIAGSLIFSLCNTGQNKLHKTNISNKSDLQEYFSYSPDKDIIIAGHRGGIQEGYPENCIASCEKTLSRVCL